MTATAVHVVAHVGRKLAIAILGAAHAAIVSAAITRAAQTKLAGIIPAQGAPSPLVRNVEGLRVRSLRSNAIRYIGSQLSIGRHAITVVRAVRMG